MEAMTTRRRFVAMLPVTLFAGIHHARRCAPGMMRVSDHPTPRPGITSAKVLTKDQLGEHKDAVPVFDMVREIPEVVDGIRCQCGCAASEGFYSLLTCYEGENAMAKMCHVCQGEGRLAVRLHKEGKTLDEIRAAIDAKFG